MTTSNVIADMQRGMVEVQRALGRIEGTLNTYVKQMAEQDRRTIDLEVRTRKVENRQHWYSGLGAAGGMLLGAFGIKLHGG
jgi:hypothetical protein